MSRPPHRRAGLGALEGFEGVKAGIPWVHISDATQETEYDELEEVILFHDQIGDPLQDFGEATGHIHYRSAGLGGAPSIEFFGGVSQMGTAQTLPEDWSISIVMDVSQFVSGLWSPTIAAQDNPAIKKSATNDFEWVGVSGSNVLAIKESASAGAHLIMASLEGLAGRVKIWFDGTQVVDDANDQSYSGGILSALGKSGSAAMHVGMAGRANVLWDADQRALMESYAAETWGVPLP